MHGLAPKFGTVIRGALAACRESSVVTLLEIEPMIYASVEVITSVIARSRSKGKRGDACS